MKFEQQIKMNNFTQFVGKYSQHYLEMLQRLLAKDILEKKKILYLYLLKLTTSKYNTLTASPQWLRASLTRNVLRSMSTCDVCNLFLIRSFSKRICLCYLGHSLEEYKNHHHRSEVHMVRRVEYSHLGLPFEFDLLEERTPVQVLVVHILEVVRQHLAIERLHLVK